MSKPIKFKYRNTGFMRHVLVFFGGRYAGIEFNKYYFRIYKITPEGALPKYLELFRRKYPHKPKPQSKDNGGKR